jgi:Flp pilus assembly protein TadD
MLGQIALNQGRYSEAIHTYSQAIEASEALHLPGLWSKLAGRGAASLRMGDLAAARRDFARGLEVAQQIESIYASLLMRTYLREFGFICPFCQSALFTPKHRYIDYRFCVN